MSTKRSAQRLETTFNRYDLIELIGEGGAGRVWSATNADGEHVAIKILTAERATDERRKRFKNEILFCQQKSHANIVPVLDHGVTPQANISLPFYVMPLFASTLRACVGNDLSTDKRLLYFDQILSGVEAAHLHEVIHRDLKPENLLFDRSADRFRVGDFGIAHFTDDELYTAVETRPDARLANFQYSAPEQRRRGGKVDVRTDIFSLGLILHELFTGAVPQGVDTRLSPLQRLSCHG